MQRVPLGRAQSVSTNCLCDVDGAGIDAPVPNVVPPEPLLHIGLSSWIIQDGNYGDFTAGQHAKFALELGALDALRPASEGPVEAHHLGAARYRVRARVVFLAEGVWVIDAGSFMAYGERWSPDDLPMVGALVEGDVYVGIDPFFYFEGLHKIPGMPPLTYPWLVQEILLETTPWIETRGEQGRRRRTRDATKESFASAVATNAWHDDDGHGHYVLLCEREGDPSAGSSSISESISERDEVLALSVECFVMEPVPNRP